MRHFPAAFIVSMCVAVFAQLALTASVYAQVQFPVGPPTPKVGDIAKTRTVDLWNNTEVSTSQSDIVEVQADRLVTRLTSSASSETRTLLFTREWNPCRTMLNSDTLICTGLFKFPLETGKKHSYDKLPNTVGRSHFSATCEVKGAEKVTVAAGAFEVVRIECSGFYNRVFDGNWSGKFNEVVWYSPAISRIVKSSYNDFNSSGSAFAKTQTELVEFIPGK